MTADPGTDPIAAAIAALQAQRGALGDAATDLAIEALLARQAAPAGGSAASAPAAAEAEQQLKLATLLFVDVVGSTALGRQLDPEDIHQLIDGALRSLAEIVASHHGRVLQYAGDSLLAVYGAGVAHEDDAENAVAAGLAIIDEVRRLAQQVKASHGIEGFDVRVGAHTGPVLLGGGVDGDNSVRGSAVNIAARMEQSAPPGGFRISQDCQRQVRGLFDLVEQPPLMIKGIDRPLQTWLVLRARQRSFQPANRGVVGVATPLIDRVREFARLREAYRVLADASQAALSTLLLVADAGVGKTRLLAEFAAWAQSQPTGARTLTARASERRVGQPYGLLRELLGSNPALRDSDPPAEARAKWLAAMTPLLDSAADVALLGHLLGLDFSDHEGVRGIQADARQIRDRGWHYASLALRRLAEAGPPLLLLLDDLHWADDASLDFIEHLLACDADLALLLLGVARPTLYERRPGWNGSGPARIDLPQLGADDSEELASALLARLDEVPRELRELIVGRAEGNPYYMEELVNMLIDQGVIVAGERWRLQLGSLPLAAQLPATLAGVLQARIDGLPRELRRVLQHAAVVGPVFWDDALHALGLHSDAELQALIARRLVVAREPTSLAGMREYGFKHHALHRVCYDSVLKRPRQVAHARVARWLAAQPGVAHLELIAGHFERGGEPSQAIAYWQRAAEQAAGRYANAAALDHAQRALALLPAEQLERRCALLLLVANVLRTQSDRARLAPCLDELASLAERLGDDALRSQVAERRARFLDDSGDAAGALAAARQALAWAPADAPECAARAQLLIASSLSTLGRAAEALPHAEAGLEQARAAGNRAVQAMLLNQLGMEANNRGDPSAAIPLFEKALALHRAASNRSNEAATLSNLAYASFELGAYAVAQAQFRQAAALCRRIGQRRSEGIVLINLALVRQCQGDAAGARDNTRDALDLLRLAGDRLGQAAALRVAGHAELALGETARAAACFAASRAQYDELGLGHLAIEAIAGQALQAMDGGETGVALAAVEEILARQNRGATLAGTDEPLRIGLICHRALAAAADPRAEAVLAATHGELMARAARISDPVLRAGYLDRVPWHRELLQRWACRLG